MEKGFRADQNEGNISYPIGQASKIHVLGPEALAAEKQSDVQPMIGWLRHNESSLGVRKQK